jgi:hypothetical protein
MILENNNFLATLLITYLNKNGPIFAIFYAIDMYSIFRNFIKILHIIVLLIYMFSCSFALLLFLLLLLILLFTSLSNYL